MTDISYFRRCACKVPVLDKAGKPLLLSDGTPKMKEVGATCPKLKQKGHSTWYFTFELEPGENGKRRRLRRGGFKTQDDAKVAAKKELKKAEGGTDILSSATVGDDLTAWVERKGSLARTTSHGYEGHIRLYLLPHLGHIKRKDLHARHIEAMYAAIKKENAERLLHHGRVVELTEARDAAKEAWIRASGKGEERRRARMAYLDANAALREGRRGLRKITGPATLHRINATLSSFLNSGIKRLEYQTNWASLIELPPVKRPKPLVWTPERVEHWQRTGEKPGPVMVWTPQQAGSFLDFVADDRLYALWDTFTFLGPRRGEMAALPWTEVSLTALSMRISAQLVEVAYRVYGEEPKADSVRTMSISTHSGLVLTTHRAQQEQERAQWEGEEAWVESGCVFTMENGAPLHPDWISRRFKRLVELSGLPPVRLHDLRHLSASLALLAGADIKVVQERLGHSSRQITSDTYTSVLPELFRTEAESTVAVVPRGGEVAYTVKKALRIPESAFAQDVAVLFVRAANTGQNSRWAVGVQAAAGGRVFGQIHTEVQVAERAVEAAEAWLRTYCTEQGYEVIRSENLADRIPAEQRTTLALVRLVIDRTSAAGRDEPVSRFLAGTRRASVGTG
ncbi:site-specific integrase [Streptomyces sp. A1547]|uniref:tyrosine-type recombinase/integrase n=1 Tax=Streptomyces sp. A1547 TaxID=2563105 RepID=UPI00109EBD53|nr:site-specific integrase [Streptomyces sp. A1547]THA38162.1 site-specific integrase [Streptomyces sp. A1547]